MYVLVRQAATTTQKVRHFSLVLRGGRQGKKPGWLPAVPNRRRAEREGPPVADRCSAIL